MGRKNILFLHVSIGAGHIRAAEAIEKAIKVKHPDWNTLSLDPSAQKFPRVKKLIEHSYLKTNRYIPRVYDLFYDNEFIYQLSKRFVRLFQKVNLNKFMKTIDSFKPDVIVCTHAFPCGMGSILKERRDIKIVAVPTDLTVHRYWVQKNVDCFAVATEKSKEFLIKRGVPKDNIKVTGLPIDPIFYQNKNKKTLSKKLVLDNTPVILIMGGGFGFGPIEKVVKALDDTDLKFQMVVVTGLNRKLNNKLERTRFKKTVKILGYIKNVDEYMQIAYLLITKPSGSTIYEAASKGLPMILVKGIAGSEWENKDFLEGLVFAPKNDKELIRMFKNSLTNPENLRPLRKQLRIFVKPDATNNIVKILEEI